MRAFTFYIEDRRSTVPNLLAGMFADEHQAREVAAQRLAESPDHLSIEVREDDQLMFVLRRASLITQASVGRF